MITISLPFRLVAEVNAREHWSSRKRRAKTQREGTLLVVANSLVKGFLKPPYRVTITRYGKRKMDDDNLSGSAKHVRDGVADALGVNDGDRSKVAWKYGQEVCGHYGVRVEIRGGRDG